MNRNEKPLKEVYLFTDGSCLNNGNNGIGGYCAILKIANSKYHKTIKGSESNTTSNRMEMTAIIKGIEALKEPCFVKVFSDSNISVKAINEWLEGWIKKNFKKTANVDLWKEYLRVSQPHQVEAVWIKSHNGHPENELCDTIAKEEAESLKQRLLDEY